jgi:hypothetical protein
MATVLFGYAYYSAYTVNPTCFTFNNPPYVVLPKMYIGAGSVLLALDFLLFSALQSVNSTFYMIQISSILVSIIAFFQTAFTILLGGVFIASYVNQRTNKQSL